MNTCSLLNFACKNREMQLDPPSQVIPNSQNQKSILKPSGPQQSMKSQGQTSLIAFFAFVLLSTLAFAHNNSDTLKFLGDRMEKKARDNYDLYMNFTLSHLNASRYNNSNDTGKEFNQDWPRLKDFWEKMEERTETKNPLKDPYRTKTETETKTKTSSGSGGSVALVMTIIVLLIFACVCSCIKEVEKDRKKREQAEKINNLERQLDQAIDAAKESGRQEERRRLELQMQMDFEDQRAKPYVIPGASDDANAARQNDYRPPQYLSLIHI
eukprot:TRINITY_DN1254_c0_g1_i4.p1 TRINITY_DN1254_c0_g1~~TRINITY_DN1254_c0_g1_i4.p1  ORF type:complete len:269 (-),score=43.48 TRINITY_DN1254_c0_g1_i4:4-810(-)